MKPVFASFTILCLLSTAFLIGLAFNIQPAKAIWNISIRPDGSIEPSTAPIDRDGDFYTLTNNINFDDLGIFIYRNNMTLDGAGYTLQGTGAWGTVGISLRGRSNVTIRNVTINTFCYGITLKESSNNTLSGNHITNSFYCINLYHASNNTISGNNITANNRTGISLDQFSNYNNISGNNIADNGGHALFSYAGISLGYSSDNNTISGNNITNNDGGIELYVASNNTISGNNIADNMHDWKGEGIYLCYSSRNTNISGNNITNNKRGIHLWHSCPQVCGHPPANCKIYHNNLVDNTQQVRIENPFSQGIFLDDGYPSGGNYWSDYVGEDIYSGSYQNETGSDGIGDTPYSGDRYPLMYWSGEIPKEEDSDEITSPFWMQWWFYAIVAIVIVVSAEVIYLKKRKPTTLPPPSESVKQSE